MPRTTQTNYNCTHKKEARDCYVCNYFLATARRERRKLKSSLKITQPTNTYNEYLGCTYLQFYNRLSEEERRIIHTGQLDHIIPITKFNFNDTSQLYECCNWRNIRIVSSKENIEKKNIIDQDLVELLELPIFI